MWLNNVRRLCPQCLYRMSVHVMDIFWSANLPCRLTAQYFCRFYVCTWDFRLQCHIYRSSANGVYMLFIIECCLEDSNNKHGWFCSETVNMVAVLHLTSLKHLGASCCNAATVTDMPLVQLSVVIMQTKRKKKASRCV